MSVAIDPQSAGESAQPELRLDTLTLNTRDLLRSRAFYTCKLGFRLLEDRGRAFVVDAGGIKLHVDGEGARPPLSYREPRLVFHTRDLQDRCRTLRDLGISVDGPRPAAGGSCAELSDPDGHPITLWER